MQRAALLSRILFRKYILLVLTGLILIGCGAPPPVQSAPVVLYGHLSKQPDDRGAEEAARNHHFAFKGNWSCLTVVTCSTVEGIQVGTEVGSFVRFVNRNDGSVVAAWAQGGWTDSYTPLTLVSAEEAQVVRENAGLFDNAGCSEQSFDHYLKTGPGQMTVVSRVHMYTGSDYAGCYTTRSILRRVAPDGSQFICHHEIAAHD